jgi:hypothetical protein
MAVTVARRPQRHPALEQGPAAFGLLVLTIVVLAALLAFGGVGRRLALFVPFPALVAVQGFRLPLELAMHAMYDRGIMPVEMSFSGRNFDVVTGATALVVAALVLRAAAAAGSSRRGTSRARPARQRGDRRATSGRRASATSAST